MSADKETPAPLTEAQRAFAQERLRQLERLINLLTIGKPGVSQARKELLAEAEIFRRHIMADNILALQKGGVVS